jgi:hypothetical protein
MNHELVHWEYRWIHSCVATDKKIWIDIHEKFVCDPYLDYDPNIKFGRDQLITLILGKFF